MSGLLSDETDEIPIPSLSTRELASSDRPSVKVEFGAGSHVGLVRDKNQDHFTIVRIARTLDVLTSNIPGFEIPEQVEEFAHAMVVADGMGGMAGGERASILAIQTGIKLVLEAPKWAFRLDEHETRLLIDRLRGYFTQVDATLVRETLHNPSLAGMGTTLTVAYSVGRHAFVVHAGDSRAYLMRDGSLRQLTRDHTLAQSLADAGKIPAASVGGHSARHVLVNFAGGPRRGIEPEAVQVDLQDGDRLLLCTDGLTGMVPDHEIAEVLRATDDPTTATHALITRALERGGRDNVTVLIARYQITS